jgi:hypothetical protein
MQYLESTMFDALAVRDTSAHNSESIPSNELPIKTLIINNSLDQTVTLQMQASRDNTNWFNVGSTFDITTGWGYQTCETFFPYGRMVAQCSVSPTTGTLSAWCEKVGHGG